MPFMVINAMKLKECDTIQNNVYYVKKRFIR